MGTTVATNALFERKGDRTVLLITKGFPRRAAHRLSEPPEALSRARIVLPELLYERVIEVDERVTAEGEVLVPVDLDEARCVRAAGEAFDDGIRLGRHRVHARLPPPRRTSAVAGRLARDIGFTQVSVSARGEPADEAGQPRRHHGGRRLRFADPAPLRGSHGGRIWAARG